MTPKTLNRYNSKWPEVKVFFILDYSSQNVLEIYLVKGFQQQNFVEGDFSIKKGRTLTCLRWYFCVLRPAGSHILLPGGQ
jgi:hypothetical protein